MIVEYIIIAFIAAILAAIAVFKWHERRLYGAAVFPDRLVPTLHGRSVAPRAVKFAYSN